MKKGYLSRIASCALALALMFSLTVQTEAASIDFTDVEASHWASSNIEFAVEKGIVNGYFDSYSNTYTFKPESSVTYEEATAMLWRALVAAEVVTESEEETAASVEKHALSMTSAAIASWAQPYVARFMDMGIIAEADLDAFVTAEGYGNPAPREVVALWTAKALGRDMVGVYYLPYEDADLIPASDRPYIDMLYRQGIMKGSIQSDGLLYFLPASGVKRSEFAAIANRVYENKSGDYDYSKDTFVYNTTGQAVNLSLSSQFVLVSNGSKAQLMRSGEMFLGTYVTSNKPYVLSGMALPDGEIPQIHFDTEPATGEGRIVSVESLYTGKDGDVEKVAIEMGDYTIYFLKDSDTKSTVQLKKGRSVTFIADGLTLIEIK